MAGSRLDRIGTIFSRTTGLLKAGGIKYQDRPLWYDIYRVFPPKYEPHIDRESEKKEVMEIFYKEDKFRALFFKKFGTNPGGIPRNLGGKNVEEPSQPFVNSCFELKKSHPDWDDNKIFESAAEKYGASRTFEMKNVMQNQNQPERQDDVMDEAKAAKNHGRKHPVITAQSLLSLFKEAKEEQEQRKANEEAEVKAPENSKPPEEK